MCINYYGLRAWYFQNRTSLNLTTSIKCIFIWALSSLSWVERERKRTARPIRCLYYQRWSCYSATRPSPSLQSSSSEPADWSSQPHSNWPNTPRFKCSSRGHSRSWSRSHLSCAPPFQQRMKESGKLLPSVVASSAKRRRTLPALMHASGHFLVCYCSIDVSVWCWHSGGGLLCHSGPRWQTPVCSAPVSGAPIKVSSV